MNPIKKPELQIRGEQVSISRTPQTDAEGQTVKTVIHADVPAGPGGAGQVSAIGTVPSFLEYSTPAGELANARRTVCGACKHFDMKAWQKFVAAAIGPSSTAEDRQTIQALKDRLLADNIAAFGLDGKFDIEKTLMGFGICRVLSDWVEGVVGRNPIHWPVAPDLHATCPTYIQVPGARMEVVTAEQPLGLFKARDLDAQKIGAKRYDDVLHAAEGKGR